MILSPAANARLILGFVGRQGTGKSTLAKHLRDRHAFTHIGFTPPLQAILRILRQPETRENYSRLASGLREMFPERGAILANEAIGRIDDMETIRRGILAVEDKLGVQLKADTHAYTGLYVVESLRWDETHGRLCGIPTYHLVGFTAPAETRFARVRNRGEKAGESDMTREQFLASEALESEREIDALVEDAEIRIDGTKSPDEMYRDLLAAVRTYGIELF